MIKTSNIYEKCCNFQVREILLPLKVSVSNPENNRLNSGKLTSIRPVVVCPEINSPAQSLASVTQPTSASTVFDKSSFFSSLAPFFWHTSHERILHVRTKRSPVKKVIRLEQKNTYQLRSSRQRFSADMVVALCATVVNSGWDMLSWINPSELLGGGCQQAAKWPTKSYFHRFIGAGHRIYNASSRLRQFLRY